MAYNESEDYDKAIADFSTAVRHDPNDTIAHCGRAAAYYRKADFAKALVDYENVIRLKPRSSDGYKGRGLCYGSMRRYDEAVSDFTECVRINPRDTWAYSHRGGAYYCQGKALEAIRDCDAAIAIDPENPDAYLFRGAAYADLRAYGRAQNELRTAISINPGRWWACNKLAWLLATCPAADDRDGKKAVEYAKKACELSAWKHWDFILTLGAAYAECGEFKEAVKWTKKSLEMAPPEGKELARSLLEGFENGRPYRLPEGNDDGETR
jgi:tetratricopeptide (TPR) repeat protein